MAMQPRREIPPMARRRSDGRDDLGFLRAQPAPLVRDRYGVVFTFSHANAMRLLTGGEVRQAGVETMEMQGVTSGPLYDFFKYSLLFSHGARHRARRTPLARSFAYKLMDALRPEMRAMAEALVLPLAGQGEVDFLNRVAAELPARMIARIACVPEADFARFGQMVYSAVRGMTVRSPQVMMRAMRDMGALTEYVEALLQARRNCAGGDFLSEYLDRAAATGLDPAEARMQIVTLIVGGSDTTRLALTALLSRLLERPGQWQALCAAPAALVPGAVREGLRYDPVTGSIAQVAERDFEMDGYPVPAGTIIAPTLVTALRDPAVYAEPDRFDIRRDDHPKLHLAFGAGAHRCLGEALARIEMEETLSVLARHLPHAELAGPPATIWGTGAIREIDGLTIRV
ncbi:cytochrome P450 [Halovulum marinum]|nr:cytochrome P450 [Halovulum marinum]